MKVPMPGHDDSENGRRSRGAPQTGAADGGPPHASPRTVIRGESPWIIDDPETGERLLALPTNYNRVVFVSLPDSSARRFCAFTDWLNCTFEFIEAQGALGKLFSILFSVLGKKF